MSVKESGLKSFPGEGGRAGTHRLVGIAWPEGVIEV